MYERKGWPMTWTKEGRFAQRMKKVHYFLEEQGLNHYEEGKLTSLIFN